MAGFEPATPSSRTRCATRLRHTPMPLRFGVIALHLPPRKKRPGRSSKGGSPVAMVEPFSYKGPRWMHETAGSVGKYFHISR